MGIKYMNKASINNFLINQYLISDKIGSGSFGEVYLAEGHKNDKKYALKVEERNRKSKLPREYKVYYELKKKNVYSVPKIYKYIETDDYNMLVMDLLGPSLEELFNIYDKQLNLITVINIACSIIDIIADFHSVGYIHRDIKPNNFLIGRLDKADTIYIMDFGLSKRYINKDKHITQNTIDTLVGTPRYTSINVHNGIEPSRRDDLESIGYMLVYFIKGRLPWQGIKKNNKKDMHARIGKIKQETSLEILTEGLPLCFAKYLEYTRKLEFEEEPDYKYLKNLFIKDMPQNKGYEKFPWIK